MILPIYLYGSEKLRNENADADLQDKEGLTKLIADMDETLKAADGCGLAAPQVGVNLNVVIVDGRDLSETYEYLHDFYRVMINPVVLEESEEVCEYSEGCLSVPGIYAEVTRPSKIKVEYYNEKFEKVVEEFDRFACRKDLLFRDAAEGLEFVFKPFKVLLRCDDFALKVIPFGRTLCNA